jgi:hypothetical protein
MEDKKIKENRRAKFLAKMGNKNKPKKDIKEPNIAPPSKTEINSQPQPISPANPNSQQPNTQTTKLPSLNSIMNNSNNSNPDLNKFINNLNSFSKMINTTLKSNNQDNSFGNNNNNQSQSTYQNSPKINYNEVLEKMSQFDYMINFQSILKKILIIILTILHCLNYQPLNNSFIFKYTFIVLEMSSLLFNKYYNDQKKSLTMGTQNNNMTGQPPDQMENISQFIKNNFDIFNYVFFIFNLIRDIIADISIIIIINIVFFLINNEN